MTEKPPEHFCLNLTRFPPPPPPPSAPPPPPRQTCTYCFICCHQRSHEASCPGGARSHTPCSMMMSSYVLKLSRCPAVQTLRAGSSTHSHTHDAFVGHVVDVTLRADFLYWMTILWGWLSVNLHFGGRAASKCEAAAVASQSVRTCSCVAVGGFVFNVAVGEATRGHFKFVSAHLFFCRCSAINNKVKQRIKRPGGNGE